MAAAHDHRQPSRSQTGRSLSTDPRPTSFSRIRQRPSFFFPANYLFPPSSTSYPNVGQAAGFPPPLKLELQPPHVQITSAVCTTITLDRAEMEINVEVNNPNRVNCTLLSLEIMVECKGRKLLTQNFEREMSIRPNLTHSITKLPLRIGYNSLLASSPDIKRGQLLPYTLTAILTFQEEELRSSTKSIKAEHEGHLPIPVEPSFRIKSAKINEVSTSHCCVELQLKVGNRNEFDMSVVKVEYEAALAGNKVVKGTSGGGGAGDLVVKSMGFCIINFPVSIWPKEFGAAVWNILRGRSGKGLLNIQWMMEADTSFGRIQF